MGCSLPKARTRLPRTDLFDLIVSAWWTPKDRRRRAPPLWPAARACSALTWGGFEPQISHVIPGSLSKHPFQYQHVEELAADLQFLPHLAPDDKTRIFVQFDGGALLGIHVKPRFDNPFFPTNLQERMSQQLGPNAFAPSVGADVETVDFSNVPCFEALIEDISDHPDGSIIRESEQNILDSFSPFAFSECLFFLE